MLKGASFWQPVGVKPRDPSQQIMLIPFPSCAQSHMVYDLLYHVSYWLPLLLHSGLLLAERVRQTG